MKYKRTSRVTKYKKRTFKKRSTAPKRRYKKAGIGYKKKRYNKTKSKRVKSTKYW